MIFTVLVYLHLVLAGKSWKSTPNSVYCDKTSVYFNVYLVILIGFIA